MEERFPVREIPLSLFLITVAESGERKSATDQVALRPIYEWQRMLSAVYRSELSNYQRQYEVWESLKRDFLKTLKKGMNSTGFDLPEPMRPLDPLLLVDEPTYEGLVKLLAVGQPSMGVFSDERGRFFGGHAMNRDNQIKTISGLSSLWDSRPVNRSRAGEGSMILYGRRVSLHLMIQESILAQLMGNKDIEQQGFCLDALCHFLLLQQALGLTLIKTLVNIKIFLAINLKSIICWIRSCLLTLYQLRKMNLNRNQ